MNPVQIENGNKILSLKGGKNKESATVLNPDDFVWDRPDPDRIGKNAYLHIITGPVAGPDETLTPTLATMPALLQAVQLPPWPWAVQPSGAVTRSPPA